MIACLGRGIASGALPLLALVGVVASGAESARAGEARGDPGPDPYDRLLQREVARLAALKGRPEMIAPLAVIAGMADELRPRALEAALRTVADDGATDPLVAAQAALLLAARLEQRGAVGEADRRRARLGLLTGFWVVGPFGEGRASFGQAFPPEDEGGVVDATKRYAGKEREVSWRASTGAVRQGALLIDGLLRPDSQAAGYVATRVRADGVRQAVLRLGSSGPIKVWVNGQLVLARDVVRLAALDQDAVAVRLRRGDNRILIKSVITDGPWRILARLTAPDGRALAVTEEDPSGGARERSAVVKAGATKTGAAPAGGGPRTLERLLRARTAHAPAGAAGAQAWLDLARYLVWQGPNDRDARDDVAALEQAIARQPSVAALVALADVGRDDDERRRALERAAALAAPGAANGAALEKAETALVLSKLGDVARLQRRDAIALERWRQALKVDATCWMATLALADEEQSAGLTQAALARLEALPPALREVRRVGMAFVRLLDALDRPAEADALLADLQRTGQNDAELAHQQSSRARLRGDGHGQVAPMRRVAAARPDVPSVSIDLARALEGDGDSAAALAVLQELVARLPDEVSAQSALGKLLHRLGRIDEARQHLALAVALRPQDAPLRRYAERLSPAVQGQGQSQDQEQNGGGEDLARRYAADPVMLLPPSWRTAGESSTELPVDPAVVLLDRRVVRVHRNGLADTFAQRVVEIATDRGAEDNKEFAVRYQPGSEEVEIRQARIYRHLPGGDTQVLQASDRDDRDLSEPWYGLYYDQRAAVVRFEGLRAGDVLDIQYSVAAISSQNELSDYFGDLQFVAEGIPKRQWDYTLIGPQSRTFFTNTPSVASLTQRHSNEGKERVLRFAARDIPKIDAEPAMPGFAEVTPYLHVSTYAGWPDVGRWYWRLIVDQLAADETLRQAAHQAVPRAMAELDKVRAIHALVLTGTRYVGLEFGIHGFKPYKVTQVLARRFGDCKDKAALMVALLREVGVEAELVLLRTRRAGRIDTQPASLAVFDHAIAYVPRLGLYLDGTAEFSGMDELPSQDQGVMGLRVSAAGAVLVDTPVLPSSRNRAQRRWDITVDGAGNAQISEDLTIAGQAAAQWREHYQTPGERLERYGKVWTGRFPGAALRAVDMPGLDDRSRPVTVHATASVPRFGSGFGGGELALPITAREGEFTRAYARLSARKQDLVIEYPWQHKEELVFHLPAGMEVRHLPAARELSSEFGHFRLEIIPEGPGVVRVRSDLDVTRWRLSPADYPRFREFLGAIDAALADRLVVLALDPA